MPSCCSCFLLTLEPYHATTAPVPLPPPRLLLRMPKATGSSKGSTDRKHSRSSGSRSASSRTDSGSASGRRGKSASAAIVSTKVKVPPAEAGGLHPSVHRSPECPLADTSPRSASVSSGNFTLHEMFTSHKTPLGHRSRSSDPGGMGAEPPGRRRHDVDREIERQAVCALRREKEQRHGFREVKGARVSMRGVPRTHDVAVEEVGSSRCGFSEEGVTS